MGKVQVKIAPWAAMVWDLEANGPLVFEKAVTTPLTVTQLLAELDEKRLREVLFDDGGISDSVIVVINGVFLHSDEASARTVEGGEVILLFPSFGGG